MSDLPILYSTPMIRAQIAGLKTQTRRVLKEQPGDLDKPFMMDDGSWHVTGPRGDHMSPLAVRFRKGDRLWVRETISFDRKWTGTKPRDVPPGEPVWYWAGGNPTRGDWTKPIVSIHMPRWASRLTDIVTDVRVQRLQDISRDDAMDEGIPQTWGGFGGDPPEWAVDSISAKYGAPGSHLYDNRTSVENYAILWDVINGAGSWGLNPWVCAISFEVAKRNIDEASK